jgi:hypothetical protein
MSGQLNAFWRQPGRRVFARLGMRAITVVIKVGRLSRDSGRYLVGPVQLREQFEMGALAQCRFARPQEFAGRFVDFLLGSGARHTR